MQFTFTLVEFSKWNSRTVELYYQDQNRHSIIFTGDRHFLSYSRRHTVYSEYCCHPRCRWWRWAKDGLAARCPVATGTQPPPSPSVGRRRRCRRRWWVRGSWCASPGRRYRGRETQYLWRSELTPARGLSGRTARPSSLSTDTCTQTLPLNVHRQNSTNEKTSLKLCDSLTNVERTMSRKGYSNSSFFSSGGWAIHISWSNSYLCVLVCVCVWMLTRVAQIITAASRDM